MTLGPIVRTEGLSVRRGGKTVLDGVDVIVRPGTIVGIVGPNGAGKTTLFDVLSARLGGFNGAAFVAGRPVRSDVMAVRRSVSVAHVPEGAALALTGWRYLAFVAAVEGYAAPTTDQRRLAGALGMTEALGRPMRSYSHGMLKKAAILASLDPNAALHVHDESFNGLDILALRALKTFFCEWVEAGRALLVCSHTLPMLYGWCDEIVLLAEGQVVQRWQKPALGSGGIGLERFEDEVFSSYREPSRP